MPVLAAGTIILNGVTYKLADADVFERSIDQFPAKIVIGDRRLRDQSLASEWVFVGDLTDGAGIRYHDPSIHTRRFWLSRMVDTRWKNRIVLGPGLTALTTNVPADAPVWMEHWVEDDIVVMVTPTRIRYHTGTGDWAIPTTPATGIISGGISGAQYKSAFFVAAGSSYWYSTDAGDNFTESAFASDDARFFCVFDQKLIRIDASGNIYWSTFDHTGAPAASNWTAKGSTLPNHTINGMIVWHDLDGAPAIFIATTRGLYIFDFDADRLYEYYKWNFGDTYHAYRMAVWNQDLYVSDNRSLLRFTDAGITSVGPDKDDGFDSILNGRIRWLLPLQNYLLAAIDTAGISTRNSTIWAYNGRGWHQITLGTATNADIATMAWRNNVLFFSQAALSRYVTLPDSSEHPKDISTSTYFGQTGGTLVLTYLQAPYFDGGLANVDKNALAVIIEVLGLDNATERVAVYYTVNNSTTYNQLGSTITANGQTTLSFGTGAVGETIRNISFRVGLTNAISTFTPGTHDLRSPIIISAKLRYMEVPSQLYAHTFAVDLTGGQGNEAFTQRANLITAKNSQTLVVLQLGNPTQSITGRVSQLQGVRNDKNQRVPGVYNVTFVQPV